MARASTHRRVYHQYLGALYYDRRMEADNGFWRTRNVHRAACVLVIRRAVDPGGGRRWRFRHCFAGRADQWRAPMSPDASQTRWLPADMPSNMAKGETWME